MRPLVQRVGRDGTSRRGDRSVVLAQRAGGRDDEFQASQRESVDSPPVRVDPVGLFARQQLTACHSRNRLGQGDHRLVPPLSDQVAGLA